MTKQFVMPVGPSYKLYGGLPVFYTQALHYGHRAVNSEPSLAILHDTDGLDSRQELYDSDRLVSVHYLVGLYPGYEGPIVIKYLSEVSDYANGAGYGSMGGIPGNLNPHAVQYEIEYKSMSAATLDAYAIVVATSVKYWRQRNVDLRFVRHADIDSRKKDPRYVYQDMLTRIYHYIPLVQV